MLKSVIGCIKYVRLRRVCRNGLMLNHPNIGTFRSVVLNLYGYEDRLPRFPVLPASRNFSFLLEMEYPLKGQGHKIWFGSKWYHWIDLDLKGTGTRHLIWLKVVSLERSWWVGLREDLYTFLKCFFIFFIHILKSLVVLAKIMPIANENRIGFVN